MQLAVYMDDSSDQKQQEIVVAGAAFGLSPRWFDAERYWNRELSRHALTTFHATECESLRGEFAKFRIQGDRRTAQDSAGRIRMNLIEIANAESILYAAVGIRRDDWKAAVSQERFRSLRMPEDPVFFAYHLLMIQCVDRISRHHSMGTAAFVCDRHNRSHLAKVAYERLKLLNPESAVHMGSMDHRSSIGNAPLQLADLVAHEARLYMLGNDKRPSFVKLRERMFYASVATTEYIEQMLSVQDPDRLHALRN